MTNILRSIQHNTIGNSKTLSKLWAIRLLSEAVPLSEMMDNDLEIRNDITQFPHHLTESDIGKCYLPLIINFQSINIEPDDRCMVLQSFKEPIEIRGFKVDSDVRIDNTITNNGFYCSGSYHVVLYPDTEYEHDKIISYVNMRYGDWEILFSKSAI